METTRVATASRPGCSLLNLYDWESVMTTPRTKESTEQKTGRTIAHLLLDSSGSMQAGKEETMQAFNCYIKAMHEDESTSEMTMSVSHFNSGVGVTVISEAVKPGDVDFLTDENYKPNGGTPLYDAIGRVIESTKKLANPDDRVLIIVQTDGQENASHEYRHENIKQIILDQQAHGWEFVYLGKGIDAMDTGAFIGFAAGQTISYDHDTVRVATSSLVSRSASYAGGGSSSSADGKTEDFRKN